MSLQLTSTFQLKLILLELNNQLKINSQRKEELCLELIQVKRLLYLLMMSTCLLLNFMVPNHQLNSYDFSLIRRDSMTERNFTGRMLKIQLLLLALLLQEVVETQFQHDL